MQLVRWSNACSWFEWSSDISQSFQWIGTVHILMCNVMLMKLMETFGGRPSKCLSVSFTWLYVE
jgi:hypothetical protein